MSLIKRSFFVLLIPFFGMVTFFASSQSKAQTSLGLSGHQYSLSLEQLGVDSALSIRGVDGMSGFSFAIPSTEQVQQLDISLDFRVSPSLLESVSHLKVYLNDQVIKVIELSSHMLDKSQQMRFSLPVHLIKEQNEVAIQLIGHYTWQCEDPLHTSLWASVSPTTKLHFSVLPRIIPNDLSLLPAPFFEGADSARLAIPLVMYNTSPAYTEAAAMVASWLGIQAAHRGAVFRVQNELPTRGSAIVFLDDASVISGLLHLKDMSEAEVRMVPNPNDAFGKLLIIKGSNAENIKLAAKTVALAATALSGDRVQAMKIQEPSRKPYDAPAWISTDRAVSFKELAPHNDFTAHDFFNNEVRLHLRLPPDLFGWKGKQALMNLRYFYTLQSASEKADLQVRINYAELTKLKLRGRPEQALTTMDADTGTGRAKVELPLIRLGSTASMQFNFLYENAAKRDCELSMVDTYRSAIDPSSTIDLRGFEHFIAMPNLAAFGTAGYPFSKMADLSETAVILSESPSLSELSTLMTFVGQIGFATGYPATRLHVQYGADAAALINKDLLLFSFGKKHPLFSQWEHLMPRVELAKNSEPSWLKQIAQRFLTAEEIIAKTVPFTPLLELKQFESPITKKRTVVAMISSDPTQAFEAAQNVVSNTKILPRIQGGVTLIGSDQVLAFEFPPSYYVGQLTPFVTLVWYLEHHPLIVILLFIVGALLISTVIFLVLRAQAQRRLNIEPKVLG